MDIKKHNMKMNIYAILAALFTILFIAAIYIVQLNKTVSENVIQNIGELASHDQNSIQSNIEENWKELEYIQGKFASYHCDTIEQIELQMNVECANSEFSHIYMVGANGKVYTDKFLVYDPENNGQNGRIDLLPFFENGEDYVVSRFDDKVETAGLTRESILYGIRLDHFSVEGIEMAGLVGISDISSIQDRLAISSFTKDGVSRGYSAVIDLDGNYIVNVEQNIYLNKNENFFDRIQESRKSELTTDQISEKMEAGETFSFSHTNAEGVQQIVYCMPFEKDGIPWYFLSSVESTVFSEQNRAFLAMSMVMLAGIVIVIVVVLFFVVSSQNKVITANAEARARTTFLANMSHEIRTPLNGIIGLIFLMEKDLEGDQENEVVLQRLIKAKSTTQYLLSLINNILDISKLQAGKVALNKETLSVDILIDTVWSMQKSSMENRGIEFVVEKDIVVPWIIGDDLMIKQVLMNILGNAAKFTPPGGKVTLSVNQLLKDEDQVLTTFICSDTGCGMSREFLDHIWDSFSQERSSNGDSVKGTGLGMAISKLLVNAMGGEIQVDSVQGKGSTFYVRIPSVIAEEPALFHKDAKALPEKSALDAGAIKIMVAEDNELNAEILIEILESEGFEVIHAQNGQEAVDIFRNSDEGEIHVILMDMQMPVLDGCGATEEIRHMNRPDARSVFIFACTANNFNEDRERAEQSGMNDFLSKPIDVKELLKKIGSVYVSDTQNQLPERSGL